MSSILCIPAWLSMLNSFVRFVHIYTEAKEINIINSFYLLFILSNELLDFYVRGSLYVFYGIKTDICLFNQVLVIRSCFC